MNYYTNILLFEFVFIVSFFFFMQKRYMFINYRYLTTLTLTRHNTVSTNFISSFKYTDLQKLYYIACIIGLVIFVVLGNISIIEFDWFIGIQKLLYFGGFIGGAMLLFGCAYFQNELAFSLKETNEEDKNEEIINSIIQKKEIQGILVADIAYTMIFSIIVMLTSCRFFIEEGVFMTSNIYQNLFTNYL